MKRRIAIQSIAGVVFGSTAGCLSSDGTSNNQPRKDKPVGLSIENNSNEEREVTVKISKSSEEVIFEKTYEIAAEKSISKESVLPAGEYVVFVKIPGVAEREEKWTMDGWETNTIVIATKESVHIYAGCHDD